VWAPEALVDEVLLGRLKGHRRPILDTKFIGSTPFNATLDEENNIRVWDIRLYNCIQIIRGQASTLAIGILPVDNNCFMLYGKRFI
jgi:WD40 repeat protein